MAYTTIDDPSAYFKVQLYTGDGTAIGSGGQAITFDDTDTDMQPDFTWIKNRDATDTHSLFDAVRGATNILSSVVNSAESNNTESLTTWGSDGFTVGNKDTVNTNTEKFVSWNWKAGTTGSGTTSGGGTGQAYSFSASTTAGFSITQYEGNGTDAHTIPHSLGAVPTIVWAKNRDGDNGWFCMQPNGTTDPWTDFAYLDLTTAFADEDTAWSDEQPTSSVVTLGNAGSCNTNANTYILYCWTPIQGYSKFGFYTGNGNANGTFVYTGFRPAWIMTKRTDGANGWIIYDNQRQGYNPNNDELFAEVTDAEVTTDDRFDILSNGFKSRSASQDTNGNGSGYSYMAFAEQPFVNSNGVPCTAR